jgi:electron transfer flavoprotein beta subunit
MEILVCVKRVPDTAENEFELNSAGNDLDRDDLVYSVNEWDNYAVEEAIQIVDNVGGSVTVVTVGDDESEEVLRREMAMGANNGVLLSDEAFEGSDGRGIAAILKAEVEKGKYDLILTGAQADEGAPVLPPLPGSGEIPLPIGGRLPPLPGDSGPDAGCFR